MTSSRLSYPAVKRFLDVVAVLVLLGPVLVVLAVASAGALLVQGRPVLFTQRRVGWHGKPFLLRKLRTMTGGPAAGRAYQERHRITRYGRLVRRLRIDELPQLLNVLGGSMSLVGPRPLLPDHLALVGGGGRRHDVRPGLTCYAQLELAERGYLDKHRQVELDEAYVAGLSLRTDVAILARTASAWLRRHGDEDA
jgi:sugar transferase EpsL